MSGGEDLWVEVGDGCGVSWGVRRDDDRPRWELVGVLGGREQLQVQVG